MELVVRSDILDDDPGEPLLGLEQVPFRLYAILHYNVQLFAQETNLPYLLEAHVSFELVRTGVTLPEKADARRTDGHKASLLTVDPVLDGDDVEDTVGVEVLGPLQEPEHGVLDGDILNLLVFIAHLALNFSRRTVLHCYDAFNDPVAYQARNETGPELVLLVLIRRMRLNSKRVGGQLYQRRRRAPIVDCETILDQLA